jgi:CCR4-NOT transcriptional complex subunit CAF120
MERESAETMDPREDRTSAIRTHLNEMMSSRMPGTSGTASTSPKINAPTSPTPLPSSINEPPKGALAGDLSLPQLPPLGFGASDPEGMRRTLTPIVEGGSPAERNPTLPVIPGAPAANPPQQTEGPALPSHEIRNEDQVPNSTSPAPLSTPSAYSPTDIVSASISPMPGLSEENARDVSVVKPSPEAGISVVGGVSSERPSNDDGQAPDGPEVSTTSFQSSASPPPLSPANSSNPPASVSPGLAPPRTPSPKFSVLTSPHSMMMDSPTRAMGQSFAEFGSSAEHLSGQSSTPPTPLRAATVAPPKRQEPIKEDTSPSQNGTLDIYDQAGAMFYLHHIQQGSLEMDSQPLPDTNGKDVSSESEGVLAQPTVAPLRTRGSSSPPPTSIAHPQPLSIDVSHRKPPIQQLPRTPTLDYGPERRPFGARAAPVSNPSFTSATHSPRNASMRSNTADSNIYRENTTQLEDPDADALAALSFLERHDDVPPAAPVPTSPTIRPEVATSPSQPQQPPTIVEPEVRSPSPGSESASVYKSSFAPSKNAMERKARSEAQQAAHEAAAHRPGRGAGKPKRKPKAGGGWEDSSDEEEDEEDEEDEDVDSDGQPVAPRDDKSVSNYAASANNHRSQFSSPRGPSPLASGDASSYQTRPHPRPPRHLPPVPQPPRMQGLSLPN